jgi:hypothetical protein
MKNFWCSLELLLPSYPSFVTFANFCLVCLWLRFHSISPVFLCSYRALAVFGTNPGFRKASTLGF